MVSSPLSLMVIFPLSFNRFPARCMALVWALCFVCLCSVLHGPNLGILFVLCCVLLCWVSLTGVLHGGFVLHGPNLGIVFVPVLVLCPLVLGLLHWCTARRCL